MRSFIAGYLPASPVQVARSNAHNDRAASFFSISVDKGIFVKEAVERALPPDTIGSVTDGVLPNVGELRRSGHQPMT